jgi:Protein of unknown function (DUF2934)
MATTKSAVATVSEEKIRSIAHQLWVEAGQPEGQAEEHWFKAIEVASVKAAKAAKAKPAVKSAPAKATATKAASKPATNKPTK